ncbi:hypothetical protein HGB48_29960, partial [Actinomadura latina]
MNRCTQPGCAGGIDADGFCDVCDPESILADPDLTAILDLDRPVGVLLFSVLHCVSDDDLVR